MDAVSCGSRVGWRLNKLCRWKLYNSPGVHTRKEPKRFYPNGSLAAHVLGFVGLDGTGLAGIEQVYNEKIGGEPGKLFIERDSSGHAYESTEVPGRAGQTIVLTIDQGIQYQAEAALTTAVSQSRAKSGTAIVLDPRTGEILALANAPTFDPNDVGAATPDQRSNWALQNIYEPGSTFKIVAFSAAIEKGLAKPNEVIDCQMGSITVAKRVIRDHTSFGTLTLTEALAKSSNVAAIKLGLRVGDPTMHEYITRFGFGSRTGIELPGETAGMLHPLEALAGIVDWIRCHRSGSGRDSAADGCGVWRSGKRRCASRAASGSRDPKRGGRGGLSSKSGTATSDQQGNSIRCCAACSKA